MENPIYGVLVLVYLMVLIGVGAIKARKIKSQSDFSLAGRGLSTFVLVGTLLATWMGTGSIFGNAEETFRVGVPAFFIPLAGGLGIIALYFLAARVRRSEQFTLQDILEDRFGVWARILGTITLLMAYVIIVSYQYRAGSSVIMYLFPSVSSAMAICFVAAFVILYTVLAGMYSVAYTDVANGILMALGLFIALPVVYSQAGGFSEVLNTIGPEKNQLLGHYSPAHLLSILLPSFLLLLGDANMYTRFFSAKSPEAAKKSAVYMFFGVVILEFAIIALALGASALIAQGKLAAPQVDGHIIVQLAFFGLPTLLGAVLVATVVAIVVSTADSYLLAPATSLVRDVYQRFLNPSADDATIVRTSRLTVLGLGLLALALAFTSDEFFSVSLFAYTLYGAGITPALMAAFFWKRATPAGAVSSILAGVITAIVWKATVTNSSVDAVIPAAAVNIFVLIAVSLMTKNKD